MPLRPLVSRFPASWFGLSLILAPPCAAGLVLNEIHPDPNGSDGGREFVEILNVGEATLSLEGVSIEFGNGATGGPWEKRWTGSAGIEMLPGSRFLVADRNWTGGAVPDVEVWLGLQNGPDAVRLTRDGVVLDLVGYGPLTDPLMFEGTPARLKTGESLARRPDGRDTSDNGADLVPADPTPGAANFRPYELTVTGWRADPPSLDRPGHPVAVSLTLFNSGTEPHPRGPVALLMGGERSEAYLDGLDPDDSLSLVFGLQPRLSGAFDLEVVLPPVSGTEPASLFPGRYQVGPGALVLNEVQSKPGDGEGEWVELRAPGPGSVLLSGFGLRDADGDTRTLPDVIAEPDELVVLAQDSLALVSWLQENGRLGAPEACAMPGTILGLAGWPNLNNSPPDSRDFSDRLVLTDSTGVVVDHLTLDGSGYLAVPVPEGRSLERQAVVPMNPGYSNWLPCGVATGGTPGCANSVAGPVGMAGELTVSPRVLDRHAGGVLKITFEVPVGSQAWRAFVYDLWGHRVRDLGGDDLGPGRRSLVWDGGDDAGGAAGTGGYIVVVQSGRGTAKVLVAVR